MCICSGKLISPMSVYDENSQVLEVGLSLGRKEENPSILLGLEIRNLRRNGGALSHPEIVFVYVFRYFD